jgi:hypothetical protein
MRGYILEVIELWIEKNMCFELATIIKISKYGKGIYKREFTKGLTLLRINNWLQLWGSNPQWVNENPESRLLGNGVSERKRKKNTLRDMYKERKENYVHVLTDNF